MCKLGCIRIYASCGKTPVEDQTEIYKWWEETQESTPNQCQLSMFLKFDQPVFSCEFKYNHN